MTRQDCYDKNDEKLYNARGEICGYKRHIPLDLLDAIIDCAVDETVAIMKMKERERERIADKGEQE